MMPNSLMIFDHTLCWIHAERIIIRLIPINNEHVKAVDDVCEQFWLLYRDLKGYKFNLSMIQAEDIKFHFQAMCGSKTAYVTFKLALKWMGLHLSFSSLLRYTINAAELRVV
jgi:hypothetical protein